MNIQANETAAAPVVGKKRRKRRVIKLSVTEEVIRSLPEGVTYNDPNKKPAKSSSKAAAAAAAAASKEENKDGDIVTVGEFTVNLAVVDKD